MLGGFDEAVLESRGEVADLVFAHGGFGELLESAGVVFFDVVAKDSCRSLPQIAFKVQRVASKVGEFVEIVGETDDTELATIVFFSAPASEVMKTKVVSGRQGLADVDDFWVVRNVISLNVDESGSAEVSWIFRGWRTLYWW